MKKYQSCLAIVLIAAMMACHQTPDKSNESSAVTTAPSGGQENVSDSLSEKDIVKVAVSSKDHTTLVAALKQADLVTALSNAGPFTVFAPTNAAFDKLPAGTVAGLMKDDKKDDLRNVLQYHVALGVLKPESFKDGQVLGMVNGDNLTVNVKDGKISLNNSAHVINSVPTSNGIIYVIDAVLLPPNK
ncbi:MAG: fasciclin domain-containing protein [Bacteroidetes bacterium]|nr:fasciclin domain-containing protein [Bacteroidota bacterium]